jgi:FKBP-type peptidyl-prolyl cis-trans isomerase
MMKRALLLFGALALTGCLDTTAPKGSDPANETFATSLGVNIAQMQKTTSGTYYQDLTVGTGTPLSASTATVNTQVTFDYTGWLSNGTQFDAGTNAGPEALGGLLYGFVDGMIGMNVGGVRLIVIPSDLGYGNAAQSTPSGTSIPANSTLVFKVKLNSVQ